MRGLGTGIVLALLTTTSAYTGGNAMQGEEIEPPSSFEIPFNGPGQLATIWSWGRDRPDGEKALVLTIHGQSRRLEVEAPDRVRWRSPTELIVEQSVEPVRNGSGTRILRMTREGAVLAVLSDRDGLGNAEPSHTGDRVLLQRYQQGLRGFQVRSLAQGFRVLADYPEPKNTEMGSMSTPPVWSPNGSKFAAGIYVSNPPKEPGRLYARLAIVSGDTSGYTWLPDSSPGRLPVHGGVIPLFWNESGIYVRTARIGGGLLLCDPDGGGCTPIYAPGKDLAVLEARPIANGLALLLVKDFTVDPLEARGKEIHQVDLNTGDGHRLLRMPDGVFISGIDWIKDCHSS